MGTSVLTGTLPPTQVLPNVVLPLSELTVRSKTVTCEGRGACVRVVTVGFTEVLGRCVGDVVNWIMCGTAPPDRGRGSALDMRVHGSRTRGAFMDRCNLRYFPM
jgi:hypothetical protein